MKIVENEKIIIKNQKIKTKYFRKYGNILCAKNLDTVYKALYNDGVFRFLISKSKLGEDF